MYNFSPEIFDLHDMKSPYGWYSLELCQVCNLGNFNLYRTD